MVQSLREQRKKKVIEVLNKARSMELQAIHQYMNQHYNLADMDYGDLAAKLKLIAIDEMRHAEMFAERIKELTGEPTADLAGKVEKGQKVEVIFTRTAHAHGHNSTCVDSFNHRQAGQVDTVQLL